MKKIILKIAKRLVCLKPKLFLKISDFLCGQFQLNINRNLCNPNQKKLLLCYLNVKNSNTDNIYHANVLHCVQMIKIFIDMDFCIDTCRCDDDFAYEIIRKRKYDIIVGQGKNFKKICQNSLNIKAKKILFATECFPLDVSERYAQRIAYFKKRHPSIDYKKSIVRNGFFDKEMFSISDVVVAMNSDYNTISMRKCNSNVYTINCNIISNRDFVFERDIDLESIKVNKKNFLWFGSQGFIHKGADIVIDAFRELKKYSLSLYGINPNEENLYNVLKAPNVTNCGFMNVQSESFIKDIAQRFSFMVFPSCSEGMSTAVATCMAHGIIPIITKETGFEPCEGIIVLDNYSVECVKSAIEKVVQMDANTILKMRRSAYKHACENFSLESFDQRFREIMCEVVRP